MNYNYKKLGLSFVTFIMMSLSDVSIASLYNRGDGLIYDDALNITWLQDANISSNRYSWDQAQTWASYLNYGGYDNWRLPSTDEFGELFIVLTNNATNNLIGNIVPEYTDFFDNVQSRYWTNSDTGVSHKNAWYFNMLGNSSGWERKYNNNYTWAVRNGDVASVPLPSAFWLYSSSIPIIGILRSRRNSSFALSNSH